MTNNNKEITTEEAIKIIAKYPTEQDYIDDNYDAEYEGEWKDNEIQLSDYYQECNSIVRLLMPEDLKGKNIIVWFSCGAASAVAAKMTIDYFGKKNNVFIVNNPVHEEDEDNIRFLRDVSKWIGYEVFSAKNPLYNTTSAEVIWDEVQYMSGIHGAPCTRILKKGARLHYENSNKIDYHVLGFTFDEIKRHERFVKFERSNVLPVLIFAGITKNRCFDILKMRV